jgi:hypothetical protein
MDTRFNVGEDFHAREQAKKAQTGRSVHHAGRQHAAVWQARLIMLVMINVAQLWILSATVEAALASHYRVLLPLVISSCICFLITLSILFWWRPVSGKRTSTGYIRASSKD